MICFDIYLNDNKLCRAGVQDGVVLGSNISWVKGTDADDDLSLHVGGLYHSKVGDNVHPRWIERLQLATGDRITIAVIEADHADQPIDEKAYTKQSDEDQERKYFERLKAKYDGESL